MHLDIRNYGTRVAVYFAENVTLTPSNLPDVRYLPYPSRGFSIPSEAAKDIPKWLAEHYPDYRYSISPEIAFRIERELERERNISDLATANDGTVTENVLKLEPRDLQRAAINFLLHDDANKILALRMGLGKTLVSLWIAERFNLRTLYITKASLVLNVEREIFKLTGKRAVILRGRHPQQEDIAALLDPQFQYFIINYEVIGTEERDPETEKSVWPWIDLFNACAKLKQLDYTIADEAHACKNTDAQRTRALLRLNTPRKLPMSGSPVINRIEELWPMLHWVAPERFSSKGSFLNAHTSDGKTVRNPKKLQRELLPFIFYRSLADVGQLPPLVTVTHSVALPSYAQSRYRAALAGVYLAIDGSERDISGPLAELNRLREIVSDAKADSTVDYVQNILDEDPSAKVLVFSAFVQPCRQIAAELNGEAIYGELDRQERMNRVDRFENGESRVLCLTMAVGSEGLNITSATHVVFNDYAWSPEHHAQCIARTYGRLSNLHGAHVTYVETSDTGAAANVDGFIGDLLKVKAHEIATATHGVTDQARNDNSLARQLIDWLKENRG